MVKYFEVTIEDSAKSQGSGDLLVLSTPRLVAFMENMAKLSLVQPSVGYKMDITHLAPTPIGATIKIECTLIKNEKRFYEFEIAAFDEFECIAQAKHIRVIIDNEKFQQKVNAKLLTQ